MGRTDRIGFASHVPEIISDDQRLESGGKHTRELTFEDLEQLLLTMSRPQVSMLNT